jgi:hypothetical protein
MSSLDSDDNYTFLEEIATDNSVLLCQLNERFLYPQKSVVLLRGLAVASSGCILFKELCQKSCILCLKIQLHVLLPVVFGIIDLSRERYCN